MRKVDISMETGGAYSSGLDGANGPQDVKSLSGWVGRTPLSLPNFLKNLGGHSGVKPGKFIVLEGGEGVGKSTQMQCVAKFLYNQSIPHILTREPGGTALAERLRTMIVQEDLDPMEELLLILAARLHHGRSVIQPALAAGLWVLCDRFVASSLVYQGIAGGLGLEFVARLHRDTGCTLRPDKTFIIKGDPEMALARRQEIRTSCNKFEEKGMDFHKKIHEAYSLLAENDPQDYIMIDGMGPLESVTERMLPYIRAMIS